MKLIDCGVHTPYIVYDGPVKNLVDQSKFKPAGPAG